VRLQAVPARQALKRRAGRMPPARLAGGSRRPARGSARRGDGGRAAPHPGGDASPMGPAPIAAVEPGMRRKEWNADKERILALQGEVASAASR